MSLVSSTNSTGYIRQLAITMQGQSMIGNDSQLVVPLFVEVELSLSVCLSVTGPPCPLMRDTALLTGEMKL